MYRYLPDYVVLSGGWEIGRIYKEIGSPPEYGALPDRPIGKRSDGRRRGTNGRRRRGWTRLAERISGFRLDGIKKTAGCLARAAISMVSGGDGKPRSERP